MSVKWEKYKNKDILVVDYSSYDNASDMLKVLYEYTEILRKSPTTVLCLENYENCFVSQEFMDEGKRLGKEVHVEKIEKNAVLGVIGIKKLLLRAYTLFSGQKNIKTFDEKQDAMEWLAE